MSSVTFQGHTGQTSSLSRSQLSNPLDLPCFICCGHSTPHLYFFNFNVICLVGNRDFDVLQTACGWKTVVAVLVLFLLFVYQCIFSIVNAARPSVCPSNNMKVTAYAPPFRPPLSGLWKICIVFDPYILAKVRKMSYFDPYFSSQLGKMYSFDPPFSDPCRVSSRRSVLSIPIRNLTELSETFFSYSDCRPDESYPRPHIIWKDSISRSGIHLVPYCGTPMSVWLPMYYRPKLFQLANWNSIEAWHCLGVLCANCGL